MKVKTLKVTGFHTFSKPLIPCGRCKHYRRVKPNGIRFCTHHGHFANDVAVDAASLKLVDMLVGCFW